MTTQSIPVLFGADAYFHSIGSDSLSRADEQQLIEAARRGDQDARTQLITDCQRVAYRRAVGLAAFYRALRGVELDPQDIAQEAMLRLLLRMDKALASSNPCGYLRRAIEGAMLTFCRERQTAIRVPVTTQWKGTRPVDVVSLDAMIIPAGSEDIGYALMDLLAS